MKGGSGNGASLSVGALLGEPTVGAPLLRALMVMKGRLSGWAFLFMGAQLGNLEWTHLLGTSEIQMKGALEVECLSLCELCEGNLEEGHPCRGP